MDTIERTDSDLQRAIEICKSHGILAEAPETPEEKLDRLWQDFVQLAQRIEHLVDKGVKLPPRSEPWMLDYSVRLIQRAAKGVQEQ